MRVIIITNQPHLNYTVLFTTYSWSLYVHSQQTCCQKTEPSALDCWSILFPRLTSSSVPAHMHASTWTITVQLITWVPDKSRLAIGLTLVFTCLQFKATDWYSVILTTAVSQSVMEIQLVQCCIAVLPDRQACMFKPTKTSYFLHRFLTTNITGNVTGCDAFSSLSGIACFLLVMHVFDVRASSSPPRLPFYQISFLSTSIAELPMEKNRILSHSITQLIWCPGNRSFRFGTSIFTTL